MKIFSAALARAEVRARREEAHPPTDHLVDCGAKKTGVLAEAYPLLTGVELGSVRDFNYEARDKYALTACLTLPPVAQRMGR